MPFAREPSQPSQEEESEEQYEEDFEPFETTTQKFLNEGEEEKEESSKGQSEEEKVLQNPAQVYETMPAEAPQPAV